jgi:hypothetical protein
MNKDVIGKPILDSERRAIEQRVVCISFGLIHIVCRESDLLASQLVIQHQHCAIEELELIVP